MKMNFKLYAIAIIIGCCLFGSVSCDDDKDSGPAQPGFILLSLTDLMVYTGGTFDIYVPQSDDVETYVWTLPDNLTLVEGEGTYRITVQAGDEKGLIPEKAISVVAKNKSGESVPRFLYKAITISLIPGSLENYKTKKYGSKVWMIENLNEAGENGDLGRYYNDDPALGAIYGRYYTWNEAMTGIPNCPNDQNPYTWLSEGVDDEGNSYKIDNTKNAYNMQIRGVCPEGWHIPNIYDHYDLAVAIKNDYNIPGTSLGDIASMWSGYIISSGRDDGIYAATLTNTGYLAAYLKGSSPQPDGGLWDISHTGIRNNGKTFYYGGNATFPKSDDYPLYMSERETIEFNLLPGGRMNATSSAFEHAGIYSYHWTAHRVSATHAQRYTVSSSNVNYSTGGETIGSRLNVRCVANY